MEPLLSDKDLLTEIRVAEIKLDALKSITSNLDVLNKLDNHDHLSDQMKYTELTKMYVEFLKKLNTIKSKRGI